MTLKTNIPLFLLKVNIGTSGYKKTSGEKTQHLSFARHFTWTVSFNSYALVHKKHCRVSGHADSTVLKFRWSPWSAAMEVHLTPYQAHRKECFLTIFLVAVNRLHPVSNWVSRISQVFLYWALSFIGEFVFPPQMTDQWWAATKTQRTFSYTLSIVVMEKNQVWIFKHLWTSFPTCQENCSLLLGALILGSTCK